MPRLGRRLGRLQLPEAALQVVLRFSCRGGAPVLLLLQGSARGRAGRGGSGRGGGGSGVGFMRVPQLGGGMCSSLAGWASKGRAQAEPCRVGACRLCWLAGFAAIPAAVGPAPTCRRLASAKSSLCGGEHWRWRRRPGCCCCCWGNWWRCCCCCCCCCWRWRGEPPRSPPAAAAAARRSAAAAAAAAGPPRRGGFHPARREAPREVSERWQAKEHRNRPRRGLAGPPLAPTAPWSALLGTSSSSRSTTSGCARRGRLAGRACSSSLSKSMGGSMAGHWGVNGAGGVASQPLGAAAPHAGQRARRGRRRRRAPLRGLPAGSAPQKGLSCGKNSCDSVTFKCIRAG